jgi:hypothetical protein
MSSQVIPTQEKRKPFGDFSTGQLVATVLAAILISIFTTAGTLWYTQGQTLTRLATVEKAQESAVTRPELEARWKLVEKIDRNVEILIKFLLEQKGEHERE